MTASSPARPSAWVPAATCCQQARNRTKSAMLTGSTRRRRRLRLAAWSRTSRWRAHQRPSGSSMAEPAACSRARPVRARATVTGAPADRPGGKRPIGHQLLDRHRSGHLEVAADALGQRLVVGDHGVGQRVGRWPRPWPGARWGPSAPATSRPARRLPARSNQGRQAGHRPAQDQRQEEVVQLVGVTRAGAGPGRAPRRRPPGRAGRAPPAATGSPGAARRCRGRGRGTGTARVRRSSSGAPSRKVKGARSGCRGRAATARPTRRSARRPGRTRAPSSRATRPSASSGSVRQSSTVWRTSTWSGTGTGPGAAFS